MWLLCFAIFFGCKWLTWRREIARRGDVSGSRSLGYLLAWPGMEAAAFLNARRTPDAPGRRAWVEAAVKTVLGAALLWGGVRLVPPGLPLVRGWVGLVGLVLLLHFGTFHLLSLLWRQAGVDARPLMDHPARSSGLGEFWGERWNRGFHQLAADLCFRPLVRRAGPTAAMLATFAASGLVHNLVISLPAGAGFGRPTLYFLLQGVGLCAQRSAPLRRVGAGRGLTGWLFTAAFTLGPVLLLFHAPFVSRVILPFLAAIGATEVQP